MATRRASDASAAFSRAQAPVPSPDNVEELVRRRQAAQRAGDEEIAKATGEPPRHTKTTVLLSGDEALAWDQLMLRLRGDAGRKVHMSVVVRFLVDLAAADATVYDQVVEYLRDDQT